ncbi:MAG: aldo/keto reductase [Spirochaetaceae bacterium]|jgi:predicted oxidoreductase|nr:aldo/keto reductase [Spirochaetaceae bacterium]
MRRINLGKSGLQVPTIAVGCMRINTIEKKEAEGFVKAALDAGADFFDHADVYGGGTCESIFADVIGMNSTVREKIIIQTKCGIVPGRMFDFSREHILESVEGSLKRLKTDYLDVLLLHRPDGLVEPEEVAEAFDILHAGGKVRHFGVSNQNPRQIQLLRKFVKQPIAANQLQLSITNASMITAGFHVNMLDDTAVDRDGGILDFCRLEDITIQPWSPFQYGFFEGVFLGSPQFPKLNEKINEIAKKHGVSSTAIAMAWLLRHPARFQPVTGTMKAERLRECVKAADIVLSREEWYEIFLAAGYVLP